MHTHGKGMWLLFACVSWSMPMHTSILPDPHEATLSLPLIPGRRDTSARGKRRYRRSSEGRLRTFLHWVACLSMLMVSLGVSGISALPSVAAQEASCITSGPDSGAYVVRVCLNRLGASDVLAGHVQVSATVQVVSGTPPPLRHVQFYVTPQSQATSRSVLQDYLSPFTFMLPTERWTDSDYRIEVDARFEDQYTTDMAGVPVATANGVTRMPFGTGRWIPHSVEGAGPVVVAAVGDGAGGLPEAGDVANLIEGWSPDMLLYLGDVYNTGSYTEFLNHYDPTLGRMKDITNPVPGNHEGGSQFQGYRDYWDSNLHHYSTTAGRWRVIGLDSTERYGQTAPGTVQFEWLRSKLASDDDAGCTLVYFHEPRWGLVSAGDNAYLSDLWALLVAEDVDVVLTGHEHNYQRWTPMDAAGAPVANGPMHFVVGTGGHELRKFGQDDPRVIARQSTHGALRLELGEGGATFEFFDTASTVLDAGSLRCDVEPPVQSTPAATPAEEVAAPSGPGTSGTIVNTGGAGVHCRNAPNLNAEVIVTLPDGAAVELRGEPVGDWRPVRCADRDGYIDTNFIAGGG
jgi:hypothetical protein